MAQKSPENDVVELTIPTCIEKSSNGLYLASNKDITQQYKIKLKNTSNQQLYIEKETDLRDILRQYCMYRKLCDLINNEMNKLNLDFQVMDTFENQNINNNNNDNNTRISRSQVNIFRDAAYQFVQTTVNPYCDAQCGKTLYVAPPPPPPPPPPRLQRQSQQRLSRQLLVLQPESQLQLQFQAQPPPPGFGGVLSNTQNESYTSVDASNIELQTLASGSSQNPNSRPVFNSVIKNEEFVEDSSKTKKKRRCLIL